MSQTSKGAKKFAARMLAKDPDYFKNLQRKAKRTSKPNAGSFKKGNQFASLGGKASKRGRIKVPTTIDDSPVVGKVALEYEETGDPHV